MTKSDNKLPGKLQHKWNDNGLAPQTPDDFQNKGSLESSKQKTALSVSSCGRTVKDSPNKNAIVSTETRLWKSGLKPAIGDKTGNSKTKTTESKPESPFKVTLKKVKPEMNAAATEKETPECKLPVRRMHADRKGQSVSIKSARAMKPSLVASKGENSCENGVKVPSASPFPTTPQRNVKTSGDSKRRPTKKQEATYSKGSKPVIPKKKSKGLEKQNKEHSWFQRKLNKVTSKQRASNSPSEASKSSGKIKLKAIEDEKKDQEDVSVENGDDHLRINVSRLSSVRSVPTPKRTSKAEQELEALRSLGITKTMSKKTFQKVVSDTTTTPKNPTLEESSQSNVKRKSLAWESKKNFLIQDPRTNPHLTILKKDIKESYVPGLQYTLPQRKRVMDAPDILETESVDLIYEDKDSDTEAGDQMLPYVQADGLNSKGADNVGIEVVQKEESQEVATKSIGEEEKVLLRRNRREYKARLKGMKRFVFGNKQNTKK